MEDIINRANEIWEMAKNIIKSVEETNQKYKQLFGDDYFIWKYDIENAIREAKKKLVRQFVDFLLKDKNIEIERNDLENLYKNEFDAKEIFDYINFKYLQNSNTVAYEQILKKARRLAPSRTYIRGPNGWDWHDTTIDDLVKGRRLMLQIYRYCGNVGCLDEINAFEKLTNIILLNQTPATAQGGIMTRLIRQQLTYTREYSDVGLYIFDNGKINSFRIYKNGKLEVEFHKREDALKIAELLLRGS
jgi:hypothetical protein